jgi:hypothetical protein
VIFLGSLVIRVPSTAQAYGDLRVRAAAVTPCPQ